MKRRDSWKAKKGLIKKRKQEMFLVIEILVKKKMLINDCSLKLLPT